MPTGAPGSAGTEPRPAQLWLSSPVSLPAFPLWKSLPGPRFPPRVSFPSPAPHHPQLPAALPQPPVRPPSPHQRPRHSPGPRSPQPPLRLGPP